MGRKKKVKEYARDFRKKYRKRYHKKYNRRKLLKAYTVPISRKTFGFNDAKRLKRSSTKKRPYLTELILLLKKVNKRIIR